jgi:hypothetical protein
VVLRIINHSIFSPLSHHRYMLMLGVKRCDLVEVVREDAQIPDHGPDSARGNATSDASSDVGAAAALVGGTVSDRVKSTGVDAASAQVKPSLLPPRQTQIRIHPVALHGPPTHHAVS